MSEISEQSSVPVCVHGKAKLYKSKTNTNPGRLFYRCPEWETNKSCLFLWHDDAELNERQRFSDIIQKKDQDLKSKDDRIAELEAKIAELKVEVLQLKKKKKKIVKCVLYGTVILVVLYVILNS